MSGVPTAGKKFDILKISVAQGIIDSTADGIAVAGVGGIGYSGVFPITQAVHAFGYQAESDGGIAVKIELEQGFDMPTTAGSADALWVVPEEAKDLETELIVDTFKIKAYPPSSAPLGRLKFTGLAGNHASTKMSVLLGSKIYKG